MEGLLSTGPTPSSLNLKTDKVTMLLTNQFLILSTYLFSNFSDAEVGLEPDEGQLTFPPLETRLSFSHLYVLCLLGLWYLVPPGKHSSQQLAPVSKLLALRP